MPPYAILESSATTYAIFGAAAGHLPRSYAHMAFFRLLFMITIISTSPIERAEFGTNKQKDILATEIDDQGFR